MFSEAEAVAGHDVDGVADLAVADCVRDLGAVLLTVCVGENDGGVLGERVDVCVVGERVNDGVAPGKNVDVCVGVRVFVGVRVLVAVFVRVSVGVTEGEIPGDPVGGCVCVRVLVAVFVRVSVGVNEGEIPGEPVGVCVDARVRVGDRDTDAD